MEEAEEFPEPMNLLTSSSMSTKPKSQKAAHLKDRYGGEWAIIMEGTADKTTKQLAIELANEGYNLIFVTKKSGPEQRIAASTSKFGVKVEFLTSDNFINPGKVFEECFQDKDISIVVSSIAQDLKETGQ